MAGISDFSAEVVGIDLGLVMSLFPLERPRDDALTVPAHCSVKPASAGCHVLTSLAASPDRLASAGPGHPPPPRRFTPGCSWMAFAAGIALRLSASGAS